MEASRFDAVARSFARRSNRRRLLQLLAGLGLGGVLVGRSSARVSARIVCDEVKCSNASDCMMCRYGQNGACWCTCFACDFGGIAGGGVVALDGGNEAHLALLATRTADPEQPDTFAVQGQVRWTDPAWEGAGLTLESTTMTFYAPLPEVEGGREATGWMRTDQRPGEYPFVLRAVDAGPPGSGQDTVRLWVGDAVLDDPAVAGTPTPDLRPSGFRYVAEGTIVGGDLQLLRLASVVSADAPAATPSS